MWTRTAVVGVAMTLVMAACGGSSDSSDTAAPIIIEGASSQSDTVATTAATTGATSEAGQSESGQSESGDSAADDGSSAVTDEELALEFAQCMRDEGVDFPDPTVNADGSIDFGGVAGRGGLGDGAQDAFEVCGDLIQGASFLPGGGRGDLTELQDGLLEFAQCLRDEGLDVDDPDLSGGLAGAGGGPAALFGPNFDPNDPAIQDEIDACSGILAGFAPGGGN